jgi:hypothetical protein
VAGDFIAKRQGMIYFKYGRKLTRTNMTIQSYKTSLGNKGRFWIWATGHKATRARRTELRLNPIQAVSAARGTSNDLANKIRKHGGRPSDFQVVAVFSKPERLGKIAPPLVLFNSPDPRETSHDLEAVRDHITDICVGLVICFLDRKSKKFIAHARPFLLDHASLTLLESLVEKAAEVDKAGDLSDWRLQ